MKNTASERAPEDLGDFSVTPRVLTISALAAVIGVISAVVAYVLLNLIELFTNLFFYQRWSFASTAPADHQLGIFVVLVPVVGALIIGFMARYGSERIRGHGIPEAIESILLNGSRVAPKLAVLKPASAAISIGSGGPFGAEGPIIMTGGAFGSLAAQMFHLTSTERKTLLVAGAAGGMSATFAAPIASVLLAVELLLFEWKPRSFIPVALSSVAAAVVRRWLLGEGPLFPVPLHAVNLPADGLLLCLLVGLAAGAASVILTAAVYAAEDAFQRLPIHWMWWPAIGGVAIGIGGLLFPEALGVGYETIRQLLEGNSPNRLIAGILFVKASIWAIALGSGTSGGVLAPLLMIGCALGGLESSVLPDYGAGFWPLISMGAILGGTMRVPFASVIFALELTHDFNVMLPLFIAASAAYAFTTILMKRSILTEKVSRRGFHLSREYATDPLEIIFVREVMRTNIAALPVDTPITALSPALDAGYDNRQRLYPIIGSDGRLLSVITRRDLQEIAAVSADSPAQTLEAWSHRVPVTTFPDEPLRVTVYRMAESGFTRMPVVDREHPDKLVGIVSLNDLLQARGRVLEEERLRERVLRLHFPLRAWKQVS